MAKTSDPRSSGESVDAVEAQDPTEPDSVPEEDQATAETSTGGTSSDETETTLEEGEYVISRDDLPTGGQSFDYGRRPEE